MTAVVKFGAAEFLREVEKGIFDWLFGDTDDEDAQLEDMILMDMDDEGE